MTLHYFQILNGAVYKKIPVMKNLEWRKKVTAQPTKTVNTDIVSPSLDEVVNPKRGPFFLLKKWTRKSGFRSVHCLTCLFGLFSR